MKALVALIFSALSAAAQTDVLPLMPWPEKVTLGQGRFAINDAFRIGSSGHSARVDRAADRIKQRIAAKTGLPMNRDTGGPPALQLNFKEETGKYPKLGDDESYRLTVTSDEARIDAQTDLGVLHGLETFEQLVRLDQQGFAVPAVVIEDHPRFPWRGLMIDSGRHFLPVEVIRRNVDAMATVKLNVLHWHLSDDQGFRVESKLLPKLQENGSDGLYYTQEQIREIIGYAAERGIRVVPEIDLPGHTTAILAAYPELGSKPGPYAIERGWGVFDPTLDPTKEEVYKFLDTLIGEMAALFPDPYFHVGGDEVNGKDWTASASITEFKRAHGLKTNDDLQLYFSKRLSPIVTGHGKIMVGWDEILQPDLPKDSVIQSWRGLKSLATAAKAGYRVLLSNGYYVDLIWPASQHYAVDPFDKEGDVLMPEERARVLGGESAMWSEYVGPENVDSRIWPRTAAIAERLWSPQSVRDVASMYARLEAVSADLETTGVTHRSSYRPMLERIAGSTDIDALQTLADVVEPVKNYRRGSLMKQTQQTPLNRLVDAARPESDTARDFNNLVTRYLASKSPQDAASIRAKLIVWRDNNARLQPLFVKSQLMGEIKPVSAELKSAAQVGLEALDAISSGKKLTAGWAQDRLKAAEAPSAQVLVMIVPPVRRLATAAQ